MAELHPIRPNRGTDRVEPAQAATNLAQPSPEGADRASLSQASEGANSFAINLNSKYLLSLADQKPIRINPVFIGEDSIILKFQQDANSYTLEKSPGDEDPESFNFSRQAENNGPLYCKLTANKNLAVKVGDLSINITNLGNSKLVFNHSAKVQSSSQRHLPLVQNQGIRLKSENHRMDRDLYTEVEKVLGDRCLSAAVTKLLQSRGVVHGEANKGKANHLDYYLRPEGLELSDAKEITGMPEVVEQLVSAITANKKIVIFGDVDVDGTFAATTLYLALQIVEKITGFDNYEYFIPSKKRDEGYGLTIEGLRKVKDHLGADLVITVDNGISAHKAVEAAKAMGLEMIITDHHELPDTLPDTTWTNPDALDDDHPAKKLCGTGVAFRLAELILRHYYDQIKPKLIYAGLSDEHKTKLESLFNGEQIRPIMIEYLEPKDGNEEIYRKLQVLDQLLYPSKTAEDPSPNAQELQEQIRDRLVSIAEAPDLVDAMRSLWKGEHQATLAKAFAAMRLLYKRDNLEYFLNDLSIYAAIASYVDAVPQIGDNRVIMDRGLRAVNAMERVKDPRFVDFISLVKFLREKESGTFDDFDSGAIQKLSPFLNAIRREATSDLIVDLLVSSEGRDVDDLVGRYYELRERSKAKTNRFFGNIAEEIERSPNYNPGQTVFHFLNNPEAGYGALASRFLDLVKAPVILGIMGKSKLNFSGRSKADFGVDMGAEFRKIDEKIQQEFGLETSCGVHTYASAITIDKPVDFNTDQVQNSLAYIQEKLGMDSLAADELSVCHKSDAHLPLDKMSQAQRAIYNNFYEIRDHVFEQNGLKIRKAFYFPTPMLSEEEPDTKQIALIKDFVEQEIDDEAVAIGIGDSGTGYTRFNFFPSTEGLSSLDDAAKVKIDRVMKRIRSEFQEKFDCKIDAGIHFTAPVDKDKVEAIKQVFKDHFSQLEVQKPCFDYSLSLANLKLTLKAVKLLEPFDSEQGNPCFLSMPLQVYDNQKHGTRNIDFIDKARFARNDSRPSFKGKKDGYKAEVLDLKLIEQPAETAKYLSGLLNLGADRLKVNPQAKPTVVKASFMRNAKEFMDDYQRAKAMSDDPNYEPSFVFVYEPVDNIFNGRTNAEVNITSWFLADDPRIKPEFYANQAKQAQN